MSRIVVTGNPVNGFAFFALPEDWEANDIDTVFSDTDWWIADLQSMDSLTVMPIRTLTEQEDRALFPEDYDVEAQVYAEDARKWADINREGWLTLARQEDQINDNRREAGQ